MIELTEIMLKPLIACFVLAGIHVYFGLHVVARGVIFVDLAIAQVAALGSSLGFLFGFGLHSELNYWFALALTLIVAFIFSFMHIKRTRIPEEAYVAICYAIAAAGLILVLSFAPDGGEELKAKSVGHLLFVTWPEILKLTIIYLCIGAFHWFYREKFNALSFSKKTNKLKSAQLWHFLFYATFGVVVASSVEVAGVLLVFTILIAPTVCAMLFKNGILERLVTGWIISIVVTLIGILLSYIFDLPTGAIIVCTFGLFLIFALIIAAKVKPPLR